MAGNPIIEIENVTCRFGPVTAVEGVTLAIGEGTIFGFVGSDGAGKSTLLRTMATMIRPDSGRVRMAGLDTVGKRVAVKRLIGYMPQRFGLYPDLTVDENLEFFMDIYGIPARERGVRRERYLGFSNLLSFAERPAGKLSGGMKQKLGLACVLVHEPRILVLDEPTNGVDPVSRREFWEILLEMRQSGMTIVVSTAYLDEGETCDRLALMHRARILAEGSPRDIRLSSASLEEAMIRRISETDGVQSHDDVRI